MADSAQNKSAQPATGASSKDEGATLAWTCHPLKRSRGKTLGVCGVILLFAVLVWAGTESVFFTSLSMAILVMALSKFFLPTRYKLTEQKVVVKTLTHTMEKEWSIYRSYYPDKNGILLSTFAGPSRLENFRGLYLLFEGNAGEVTAFVKSRMTQTGEAK
jgi:hypothetical protein